MNLYSNAGSLWQPGILKKYFAILLLQLLCTSGLFAQAAKQEKTISLTYKEVSASVLFKALKQQTGYDFNFSPADVDQAKIGPLEYKNTPLEKVLKDLEQYGLSFHQTGNIISVSYQKPTPKSPNVPAGQGPGTIKGRVVELETSQPLPGASVRIVELNKGVSSDNNGYYRLTGAPAGKYTLQVSYVSFTTENVQVEAKAGREETYDVKMQGSNQLNEVTVTAVGKTRAPVAHTSERQVLQEIKAAQSVVSGISSQQISKTADRNAAEVVQKIAGVTVRDDKFIVIRGMNERYNLTYLNGNIAPSTELYSRAFALDLIPTRIIDKILVYKSPAPDLLADMTGGAVKIFTKDARTVKHLDVEFRTGVRQNTTFNKDFLTYQGGKYDFLGIDDGGRKLPSSVPDYGDFTKAKISQKTYAETFSSILEYGKKTALPPMQLTLNYYDTYRVGGKNLSILSSLSYQNEPTHLDVDRKQFQGGTYQIGAESQNTDASQVSLLQNFTYVLNEKNNIYFKNFLLQQGNQYTLLSNNRDNVALYNGEWSNPQGTETYLRNILLQWTQRFLYSGNVGGQHTLNKDDRHSLGWNTGYTYSQLSLPDQRIIRLQNNTNYSDSRFPKAGDFEQNFVPVFRHEDHNDLNYNKLELGHITRLWTRNNETVYNGSVDYTFKLQPWVTLKAGTYQQWKERTVFRRAFTLNEGDLNSNGYPLDRLTPQIGAFAPDMNFNLVFWRQQDLGRVWSNDYLRDDNTGLKVFDRTSGSDAYTGTEQNNSGYIAASLLPFGDKLDIYGGLRVEHNRQKVAGAIAPSQAGDVNSPVLADLKGTEWLPSLNIGYRPSGDWVIRGAYGKTLNRPEFRELSPYAEMDYVNNQQIVGNNALLFAKVTNYDLRFEWYPNANEKGETVSIGGFYKDITTPIERTIQQSFDPYMTMGPARISFQNADRAKVYGLEVDIRKSLDFLPGAFFRNLSVNANGSYIHSAVETDTVGTTDAFKNRSVYGRKLQGQAPYQFNVGLYYDNAGSGTRAAFIYNEVGERIYAAAVKGINSGPSSGGGRGSLIELPRRQLDFSLTQRIVKSLQAKFSVQNLLNQSIDMVEDVNFTFKHEKYTIIPYVPTSPGGGVGSDSISGDLPASSYRPGRFFLLTLTYGF